MADGILSTRRQRAPVARPAPVPLPAPRPAATRAPGATTAPARVPPPVAERRCRWPGCDRHPVGTGAWCSRDRHRRSEMRARGCLPGADADLPAAWAAMPRTPNGTAPRKAYPSPVLDLVREAMPGTVAELAIRCGITPESAGRAVNLLGKQGRAVAEGTWRKTWRRRDDSPRAYMEER